MEVPSHRDLQRGLWKSLHRGSCTEGYGGLFIEGPAMKVMKVSAQNGLAETLTNVESYTSPQRCIELGLTNRDLPELNSFEGSYESMSHTNAKACIMHYGYEY